MKDEKATELIPEQQEGEAIDAKSEIELDNEEDARSFFREVKSRLQNVNEWKDHAGGTSAVFQIVDQDGKEVSREVREGDYLKIDIAGPGSKDGKGYDWVQVEEMSGKSTSTSESFGFRVRPTESPYGDNDDVDHFYSHASTSTFIVERNGSSITASVHDRNTMPNSAAYDQSGKLRDAVVGTAGAMFFSKMQWQNLTAGILKKS